MFILPLCIILLVTAIERETNAMIWLFVVLSLWQCGTLVRAQPPAPLQLECQDKSDFARLLYLICSHSVLCTELYYLDVPHHNNSLIYERDFRRFQYQITQVLFFPSSSYNASLPMPGFDGYPLTFYIWPPEWQPLVTLDYTLNSSTTPCSESINIMDSNDTQILMFVYVSLSLMKDYRQYISNEHRCNDYSEVPIFNLDTGEFHCVQLSGKTSNIEASSRQLLFLLAIMALLVGFAIMAGQTFIGLQLLPPG